VVGAPDAIIPPDHKTSNMNISPATRARKRFDGWHVPLHIVFSSLPFSRLLAAFLLLIHRQPRAKSIAGQAAFGQSAVLVGERLREIRRKLR
jgi:hypothetical protein